MTIIIKTVLFLSLYTFIGAAAINLFTDVKSVRIKLLKKYRDTVEKVYKDRIRNKEMLWLYEGAQNKETFIDKIDSIIETSTIRLLVPFLTSEVFLFVSLCFAILCTVLFNILVSRFIIFNLIAFIAAIFTPYLILKQAAGIIYNKIDNQILGWLNTISNLCMSNDDIVTIIEKANFYTKPPLSKYTETFVFEARQGLTLGESFRNFEDKVENRRLKQFIKNLSVCCKHDADYKKVVDKSRTILKKYFQEKEKRQKDIKEGKKDIAITIGMGIGLFMLVLSFQDDFIYNLVSTVPGNVILGFNIAVLMFSAYKVLTLGSINY